MEFFQNRSTIRLKSFQDKYLVAEKDEQTISQSRDGSTKNAHWTVEVLEGDFVCLKSCYGTYLTASNKPTIPGRTARMLKVTQTNPGKLKSSQQQNETTSMDYKTNSALQWEPVDNELPGQLRLKTRYGNYLQANKGPPPLGNMVIHDLPKKTGPKNKKISWQVEVVDSAPDSWRESESIVSKLMTAVKTIMSEMNKGKEKIKDSVKDAKDMILKQQGSENDKSGKGGDKCGKGSDKSGKKK